MNKLAFAGPTPPEPDKPESGGRMLTILLVATAAIAVLYVLFGRKPESEPPPEPSEAQIETQRQVHGRAARALADKLGQRLTGVTCDGRGNCVVSPESAPVYCVYCVDACDVVACPSTPSPGQQRRR